MPRTTRCATSPSCPIAMASGSWASRERWPVQCGAVLSPDGSQVTFFFDRALLGRPLPRRRPHRQGEAPGHPDGRGRPSREPRLPFSRRGAGRGTEAVRLGIAKVVRCSISTMWAPTISIGRSSFKQLGEILNPSWSPDGQAIAFSAVVGGLTDLYLYDLAADSLVQLTHDPYADLQPAGRPTAGYRVRDRPLHYPARRSGRRPLYAGRARRGRGYRRAGAGIPGCEAHQPAVVARRCQPLLPRRSRRDHQRLPGAPCRRRARQGHEPVHRRQAGSPRRAPP